MSNHPPSIPLAIPSSISTSAPKKRAQFYVGRVRTGIGDTAHVVRELKKEHYTVIQEVFEIAANDPMMQLRIFRHPFPKRARDLLSGPKMYVPEDLDVELQWIGLATKVFSKHLQQFVSLRQQFERSFIAGEYPQAAANLDTIEATVGHSLWLLESRLLLAERQSGFRAQRSVLSEAKQALPVGNLHVIADFMSDRIERNMSCMAFDASVHGLLKEFGAGVKLAKVLAHFRHRVAFHMWDGGPHIPYLVYFDGLVSLVDGFLSGVRVIHASSANESWAPTEAIRLSLDHFAMTGDPRACVLRQFHGPTTIPTVQAPMEDLFLATDAYTCGDYRAAAKHANNGMCRFPEVFDFYEILAKAQVNGQFEISPAEGLPSAFAIATLLRTFLKKSDDSPKAFAQLKKLAYELDSTSFGNSLLSFCLNYGGAESILATARFHYLGQGVVSPRLGLAYRHGTDARKFLSSFIAAFPTNVTAKFIINSLNDEPSTSHFDVPIERRLKQQAHSQRKNGRFDAGFATFMSLLEAANGRPSIAEEAYRGALDCALAISRWDEAARLAVSACMSNRHFLPALHIERLIDVYENPESVVDATDVAWPILVYLSMTEEGITRDTFHVYVAVDQFLLANNATKPSEMLKPGNEEVLPDWKFFLRYVCTIDILDSCFVFQSVEELEQERVKICQYLMHADSKNAEVYLRELATLSHRAVVRSGIRHLDESKVFVDLLGIRKIIDRTLPEQYARFRKFATLDVALRQITVPAFTQTDTSETRQYILTDLGALLFTQMFQEIRGRFISSDEFGLDSYLSIRIRHGTLSGQLRSPFELHRLITRKDTAGKYKANTTWKDRLAADSDDISRAIETRLEELSIRVDQIIDTVKSKWIQVKDDGSKSEPMFDFYYRSEDILVLYVDMVTSPSYDKFVDGIFSELLGRTKVCLERIRDRVVGELRDSLNGELDRCLADVLQLAPELRIEFTQHVRQCQTDLHNALDTIANWFRLVDERAMQDFELSAVWTAAIQMCSSGRDLTVELDIQYHSMCRGETFVPLFDAAHIMLDNVVRHSGMTPSSARISAMVVNERLVMEVRNNVDVGVDLVALREKMAKLEAEQARRRWMLVRSEGGSGFYKLHKICYSDLNLANEYEVKWTVSDAGEFCARIAFSSEGIRR